jgi:hypothetical protein
MSSQQSKKVERSMSSLSFPKGHLLRYLVIVLVLTLGIYWSLASTQTGASNPSYPENQFLVTAAWLKQHLADQALVDVDVRDDTHFGGKLIPGAVHLPWTSFRYTDTARGIGGKFVGIEQAQKYAAVPASRAPIPWFYMIPSNGTAAPRPHMYLEFWTCLATKI